LLVLIYTKYELHSREQTDADEAFSLNLIMPYINFNMFTLLHVLVRLLCICFDDVLCLLQLKDAGVIEMEACLKACRVFIAHEV